MSSSPSPAAKKSRSKSRTQFVEAAPGQAHEAKEAAREKTSGGRSFWPQTPTGRKVLPVLLAAAFLLRVYHIREMFPILVDESIYLRWAEIIDHQGQWFISLLDGKQPLQYWLLALLRMVSDGDPLLAARLLSVVAGLLSTIALFALGKRLAGEPAGLIAAGLYACLPYALLYDRLAYTEALVNLFGILIAYTSIACFDRGGGSWRGTLAAGLALGLGLFTKQTVLLFAFFPALAGLRLWQGPKPRLLIRLAVIYGIGFTFMAICWIAVPEAPTLASHDMVLHHPGFFISPGELLAEPFELVPGNAALLAGYIGSYLTWPLAIAALASAAFLAARRNAAGWVIFSLAVLPLIAQVFLLKLMFPTRYPFPHFWPWLMVVALAAAELWRNPPEWLKSGGRIKQAAGLAALTLGGPVLYQAGGMLAAPSSFLDAEDVKNFLGSGPHAGWGIREAIDYLGGEAKKNGGFVLLADPIWGPPSDALFPYLNHKHGITVHEAWWTQNSGTYPIFVNGKVELIKSHYERTSGGALDFRQVERVFYVTDTNYYNQQAVQTRQPGARLVASFPKPNGRDSIDVYRMK